MRPQVEKGVGGYLFADLPAPSDTGSIRCTIKRSSGADLEGAAMVDAVVNDGFNRTLAEDASGTAGSTYITDPDLGGYPGVGDVIQIRSSVTNQTQMNQVRTVAEDTGRIYFRKPLAFNVVEGDVLRGLSVAVLLTAQQCPRIEQNFRAVFAFTVNTARVTEEVIFDVGLRASNKYIGNPARSVDLDEAWPDGYLSETREWSATDNDTALRKGWVKVQESIWAQGKNPNRIRDLKPLAGVVINRAMRHMAYFGKVPNIWVEEVPAWIELLDEDYSKQFTTVLAGIQWYDDDDSGTVSDVDEITPTSMEITILK